jgi:hypothetical protein
MNKERLTMEKKFDGYRIATPLIVVSNRDLRQLITDTVQVQPAERVANIMDSLLKRASK